MNSNYKDIQDQVTSDDFDNNALMSALVNLVDTVRNMLKSIDIELPEDIVPNAMGIELDELGFFKIQYRDKDLDSLIIAVPGIWYKDYDADYPVDMNRLIIKYKDSPIHVKDVFPNLTDKQKYDLQLGITVIGMVHANRDDVPCNCPKCLAEQVNSANVYDLVVTPDNENTFH